MKQLLNDLLFVPRVKRVSLTLLHRNFLVVLRNWPQFLFWFIIEPLGIFYAMAFGIGALIKNVGPYTYPEFLFVPFLLLNCFLLAYSDCTGELSARLKNNGYRSQLRNQISIDELIVGETIWSSFKAFVSSLVLLGVGGYLGLSTKNLELILLVLLIVSFSGAALGVLLTSFQLSKNQLDFFFASVIFPISCCSGVYFPMSVLPDFLETTLSYFPFAMSIDVARSLAHGSLVPNLFLAGAFYVIIVAVLLNIGCSRLLRQTMRTQ